MTEANPDPLSFANLERRARRFEPRYDVKYGTCVCGLGATRLLPLPSQSSASTVVYAACGFCGVFWQVGADLFDFEPLPDDEVDALYRFFFDQLTQFDFIDTGGQPMFRRKAAPGGDPNAPAELAPIISDYEFQTRSIALFELFKFARQCDWPALPLESHRTVIGAGEDAWRSAPLAFAATRRTVWLQLVALEHRRVHTSAVKEGERA